MEHINKNKVDLHTHSIYSDGSYTPEEIINAAVNTGLTAVSITDHDTINGLEAGISAAGMRGGSITFIPGVEISAVYKCSLHILGYFRPDNYQEISGFIDGMRKERHIRNLSIIKRLNELGIRITETEVAGIAGKEVFGRPHIAAALVKAGVVPTISAAFNEYLSGGRKAYVQKKSLPPEECVAAISEAGGLPVIAHPSLTGLRLKEMASLAGALIGRGLFGIEAFYPEHTETETMHYSRMAEELGLLATGGSDFHGDYRKHTELGAGKDNNLYVPDFVPEKILEALNRK